ncbi:MAG: HupE/UreJ family protein, partial [Candidatus Melainabacteria bacterium]|nr:HupE/UreJ family protein [Candidatus Melainabacteria bacterium]
MNIKLLLALILFLTLSCNASWAHKPSDSYIILKKSDLASSLIEGRFDISLRDLEYVIGIDDNYDGLITWKEVKKHHEDISDYALSSFKLKAGDSYCKNEVLEQLIDDHSDGAYSVLRFNIECPGEKIRPTVFDIDYNLFFDINPQHRGLLNIQHKDKTLTAIFSPEDSTQHFDLNTLNPLYQFAEFVKEGVWHIWIGFDHILFLLSLLLPAVLIRNKKEWSVVPSFKLAFWNVFKIVTAFTVAH